MTKIPTKAKATLILQHDGKETDLGTPKVHKVKKVFQKIIDIFTQKFL